MRLPSLRDLVPSRAVDAVTVRVLHPALHATATAAVAVAREALRWAYVGQVDGDRMGFRSFGERSMVQQPYATLVGLGHVEIGSDTLLAAGVCLAAVPESPDRSDGAPIIRIGDRVWSAPGLSIVAHRSVEVGDDVWFGPRVYITDAGHDPSDPSVPIGHRMEPAEPVRIGDGSWLGAGVVVLPGVTIGEHVTVGAGSVVCDDLPSHAVAVGSPARVVRRVDDGALSVVDGGASRTVSRRS
ncbi:acyltransferase [Dermatobacter hominis]|uniref:acyltransferase n=1 Tax=Dermatobacter hominis TaxID=2884263 RepID=UPI001D11F98A|nr:acyltransferase [Dermatobacter hominis]UDY36725.1 acyltransferase [Dermatobacter hominis]